MRHLNFRGIFPIISTPFNAKEEIVYDDVRRQVDWLIDIGVDGIGIAIASEVYKLNDKEKFDLLSTVVDQASSRVPIIMNTGAESTFSTIFYSKKAEELGANGLMIRPPSFIKTSPFLHEDFYFNIANSVNIPIFMQDQNDASISSEQAVKISDLHENLSYIKLESMPTIPKFDFCNTNSSREKLILFGGAGGLFFLEELRRGSSGTMPGSTLPDIFVKVWNLWQKKDFDNALSFYSNYSQLIKILAQSQGLSNWIYKYIMYKRGIFSKSSIHARNPAMKPSQLHFQEIDKLLDINNL